MASGSSYTVAELESKRVGAGRRYLEFLRVPSMSGGLYVLHRGETDPQSPHSEDEVYVVLRGRARLRHGEADDPVAAGSIVYVPAGLEHRFHDIQEDIETLVFFSPAEAGPSPSA